MTDAIPEAAFWKMHRAQGYPQCFVLKEDLTAIPTALQQLGVVPPTAAPTPYRFPYFKGVAGRMLKASPAGEQPGVTFLLYLFQATPAAPEITLTDRIQIGADVFQITKATVSPCGTGKLFKLALTGGGNAIL